MKLIKILTAIILGAGAFWGAEQLEEKVNQTNTTTAVVEYELKEEF